MRPRQPANGWPVVNRGFFISSLRDPYFLVQGCTGHAHVPGHGTTAVGIRQSRGEMVEDGEVEFVSLHEANSTELTKINWLFGQIQRRTRSTSVRST